MKKKSYEKTHTTEKCTKKSQKSSKIKKCIIKKQITPPTPQNKQLLKQKSPKKDEERPENLNIKN